MRVVVVDVGDAKPGMLCLHCSSPRGGRSTVGHDVQDGDTPELIASEIARRIVNDRQWCTGYFEASASGSKIMIICRDEVANCTIYGDPDVETFTVSEWGK